MSISINETLLSTNVEAYLRGNEISSITWCHKKPVLSAHLFGETKIKNTDGFRRTAFRGKQNIARLQVTMDNSLLMKIVDCLC